MKVSRLSAAAWAEGVVKSTSLTPFHNEQWLDLVVRHFGGELTLYRVDGDGIDWFVPVLAGLPWSKSGFRVGGIGYGGPLPVHGDVTSAALYDGTRRVIEHVESDRREICTAAVSIPHRAWSGLSDFVEPTESVYCTQLLDLQGDDASLLSTFSGNVRTALRKADRSGIRVRRLRQTDVNAAHELLVITQRAVGAAYITKADFFAAIVTGYKSSASYGAFRESRLLAVAVTLRGARSDFHLFHGWDRAFASLCANQALLWHVIRVARRRGARILDLGKSYTSSLASAKGRWGARPCGVFVIDRGPHR
jgi:hypothetical protein